MTIVNGARIVFGGNAIFVNGSELLVIVSLTDHKRLFEAKETA